MIAFAIIAALLVGLALFFVVPPLARGGRAASGLDGRSANLSVLREQLAQLDAELASGGVDAGQHRAARAEIERRVLDEESATEAAGAPGRAPATAWALGLVVPLLASGLYVYLGNLQGIAPAAQGSAKAVTAQDVEAMVSELARRMEKAPDDAVGWTMLARSYAALQRFPEASRAFTRAVALNPKDAQLLADAADALAMTQGQSAAGEPTRLIERALQIDPANLKALALAGTAALERKDFAAAGSYWGKARQLAAPGSELAGAIERSLEEVRLAAAQGPAASPASAATVAATATSAQVSGRVSLAPLLAARVAPGDTVFIFARAAEGPRMPLAILRRTAAELPITFTLDDSLAMAPEMKLSKFPRVVVGARVSKSGEAMPRAGDLIGQSVPVTTGSGPLEIVIDAVQP